jgi:hypothetical protein
MREGAMIIPARTHVILATYVGEASAYSPMQALYAYRDLYAGRLTEDFRYERGAVITIDGPMGGTIPTRETELQAILSRERVVGVEFHLPQASGERIRHLLMVEPFGKPTPIDPRMVWPRHLRVAHDKIELLALAYHDREVYAIDAHL